MNGVKSLGDKKLSIIVPAYNEGGNIGALLDKVLAVRLPYDIRREVMVVDDGSSDNTYDVVRKYVELHPGEPVRLLRHERNRGKGRAIRTALEYVTGDYIIIQDGDLELEPNDIAVLLKVLVDGGYEVVYGSRFLDKRNEVLYRRFYWRQAGVVRGKLAVQPEYNRRAHVLQTVPRGSDGKNTAALRTFRILPRSDGQGGKARH